MLRWGLHFATGVVWSRHQDFMNERQSRAAKRLYAVHLKDTKLSSSAGLWEHWEGAGRFVGG